MSVHAVDTRTSRDVVGLCVSVPVMGTQRIKFTHVLNFFFHIQRTKLDFPIYNLVRTKGY